MRPRRRGALHMRVVFCSSAWRAGAGRWIRVLWSVGDARFSTLDAVTAGVVGGDFFGGAGGGDVWAGLLAGVGGGGWGWAVEGGGCGAVHLFERMGLAID